MLQSKASQYTSPKSRRNRRATCFLVGLMDGEESWETPDHSLGVLPQNWGGTEQNGTVTSMVLKANANDRRKILALSIDEFVVLDLM
ncbi:hypothetical protein TNCV_3001361 [Trichonephila clavipes]|nr:hypothetical protein TNCV_3001361 [Trichonephila clavipes]